MLIIESIENTEKGNKWEKNHTHRDFSYGGSGQVFFPPTFQEETTDCD